MKAEDGDRTGDFNLGKVALQIRIQEGSKRPMGVQLRWSWFVACLLRAADGWQAIEYPRAGCRRLGATARGWLSASAEATGPVSSSGAWWASLA